MEVIKSSKEISELFASGKRYSTPYLTFLYRKNPATSTGRVAVIVGKRNGNAVWRNRAKRRLRALCRQLDGPWAKYDVALIAKSNFNGTSYQSLLSTCCKALSKLPFETE